MKYYVSTSSHGGMVQVAKFEDAYVKVSDHEAEVARLRAEVEGLRMKASRYDWIRRNAVLDGANGDQFDSEIDAAIGASA